MSTAHDFPRHFTTRISDEMYEELQDVAEQSGMTLSEVAREAFELRTAIDDERFAVLRGMASRGRTTPGVLVDEAVEILTVEDAATRLVG